MTDLGYAEMWSSFEKQSIKENWSEEDRTRISKEIQEGVSIEIKELADLGVLK